MLQPPSTLVHPFGLSPILWMLPVRVTVVPQQFRAVPSLVGKLAWLNVGPDWSNLHLRPVILPLMSSSSSGALPKNVGIHVALTLNVMRNAALTLW